MHKYFFKFIILYIQYNHDATTDTRRSRIQTFKR